MYLDASPCITYLEKLLDNKPDDRAENGVVFDREAYLRDVEGFDDTEVSIIDILSSFKYNIGYSF